MKNNPALEKIALAHLSGPETYRLSFNRAIGPLLKSIREVGQTSPMLCRKTGKGLELFSGYLRKEALKELGKKSALALVWPGSALSAVTAFRVAFFENALTRGLNTIEQAMAAQKLKRLGVNSKEAAVSYFQKAGLPASVAAIEALSELNDLEAGWKIFLAQKQVGLRYASQLCRCSASDRKALEFLLSLGATTSQFREILEMTDAMSKRDQTGIEEILSGPELVAVLRNKKLSAPEKLDLLVKSLKKMRHPNFHKLYSRHQELVREMKIPGEVKLEPSDYFEGPEYKMEITLGKSLPAREIFEKILAASRGKDWEKLFEFDDED